MAKFANLIDPVTQDFEGSTKGFIVDAISTSLGALMGTSPVSTYVESAIGVQDGGDIFVAVAECCSVCVTACLRRDCLQYVSAWNRRGR
mmetsp:Transcript_3491/g.5058  ORF Transcript_3491/g.5058 Transcript_3491/m.5058 type:complete len:89 (+) Transcript_3491:2-268(+)